MVSPTNFPPNPDNPDRAPVQGAGNDFVVSLQAGDNVNFLRHDGTWALPPGGGGGSVWGGITGTLSAQTDLQNALNLKANTASLATVATTGAYNDLSGKPTLGTLAALSYPGGTSAFLRADGTWQIPVDVNATWGNITGTLASQGDLNTALGLKATIASPTFTGTPAAPTPAISTNTTQLATTAYVIAQLGSSNPLINGTASSGASLRIAREDHVHPTDTSRMSNTVMTTAGDIIVGGVSGAPGRLAIGSNTQVLTVSGGNVVWAAGGGGGMTNPMTTAEDLIKGGASGAPARLGVGSNGNVLTVTAGAVGWAAPTGGMSNPMTTTGDIIYSSSGSTPARLGIGAANQVLGISGGVPAWQALSSTVGPTFSAYRSTNQTLTSTVAAEVVFDTELWDTANNFNPSTGRFTPQVAGKYQINGAITVNTTGAITVGWAYVSKNGSIYKRGDVLTSLGTSTTLNVSATVDMNGTTDYISLFTNVTGTGTLSAVNGVDVTWFDAHLVQPLVGPGDVVGPASATADSIAIYNGTTGKLLKDAGPLYTDLTTMSANAAASGRVITSAGANKTQQDGGVLLSNIPTMSAAAGASGRIITSAGADKTQQDSGTLLSALALLASPTFTGTPLAPTAATLTSTTQIATTAFVQQERKIDLASKSAAYTAVLADGNQGLLHPSADTTARVFTIPANASVAYPVGTTLTIVNQNAAGVITISITTDTMRLAGAGTTGSRTLAANGIATAYKLTSTEWIINGTGLT